MEIFREVIYIASDGWMITSGQVLCMVMPVILFFVVLWRTRRSWR